MLNTDTTNTKMFQ